MTLYANRPCLCFGLPATLVELWPKGSTVQLSPYAVVRMHDGETMRVPLSRISFDRCVACGEKLGGTEHEVGLCSRNACCADLLAWLSGDTASGTAAFQEAHAIGNATGQYQGSLLVAVLRWAAETTQPLNLV